MNFYDIVCDMNFKTKSPGSFMFVPQAGMRCADWLERGPMTKKSATGNMEVMVNQNSAAAERRKLSKTECVNVYIS